MSGTRIANLLNPLVSAWPHPARGVKVFHLDCLPDRTAAQLCLAASDHFWHFLDGSAAGNSMGWILL